MRLTTKDRILMAPQITHLPTALFGPIYAPAFPDALLHDALLIAGLGKSANTIPRVENLVQIPPTGSYRAIK